MTTNTAEPTVTTVLRIERSKILEVLPEVDKHVGYSFVHRDADIHWSARAIWNPRMGYFDLLFDRQTGCDRLRDKEDEEAQAFMKWLNGGALKRFHQHFFEQGMRESSPDYVYMEEGKYCMKGSPNSSYGYAYLSAWVKPGE